MTEAAVPLYVHASAVVIGETGVLIRGESGSGKTSLAAALVQAARRQGDFAALVGDDRVGLEHHSGRVVAAPHPAIAGLVEVRGRGILASPHEPACVIRLVVDLLVDGAPSSDRVPEAPPTVLLCNVELPGLALPARDGAATNALRVAAALQDQLAAVSAECL